MAYFDNAATTFPKPQIVYDFMDSFYREHGGNAGRGNHAFSMTAGKLISDTRTRLQQILQCQNKQIVFTSSATIALNMILQGLINGGKIKTVYISPFEHNAVTRVLYHFELVGTISVKILPVLQDFSYDFEEIKKLFDRQKPDLLVISHASNDIGLVSPVQDFCLLAKKYDAVTVVDMAQTAGLVNLNVGLETIDFVVFAGHKTLYGPTGISGFAMKSDFDLQPVLFGGTGFESANQDMPLDIPQRYEMGTLNIAGIAGLYAATGWILEIGIEELRQKEQSNRKQLLEIIQKYNFVRILGECNEMSSSDITRQPFVGIVSCIIEGLPSDTAASIFAEQNIAVRSGLQCAPLAHKMLGTFPAGTIRFSTSYFTNEADFAELENTMKFVEENL